jgi:hypothetical protein
MALEHIPSSLWSDRTFVLAAAATVDNAELLGTAHLLELVSADLLTDRHVVMALLEGCGDAKRGGVGEPVVQWLTNLTKSWKSDCDVVKAAVQLHGPILQAASPELRADREVVLAAVTAPQHVRYRYERDDYEHLALRYASKELLADPGLVGAAVKQEGMALKFASKQVRATKYVVIKAASQRTRAFKYASDELRSDHELILRLVRAHPSIITFCSPACREDDDFLFQVFLRAPDAVFLLPTLSRCPSVILEVVDSYPCLLDTERIKDKVSRDRYCSGSWRRQWQKLFGQKVAEAWCRQFKESISEAEMWMDHVCGGYPEEDDFIEELEAEKKQDKQWRQARFFRLKLSASVYR